MTSNTQQKPITSHKIDLSLCTLCELCITICPAAVPAKNEKKEVFFQADKVELYIRCGHCMAMCDAAAISYDSSAGTDNITRNAPALILFHAPKGAEEYTVDAHIYLTYSLFAAHSLGLGATAIGLIGPGINRSKPLRHLFRIPEGNEVMESMIVGYPKFPFKRAIVRPKTKVTFIS